MVDNQHCLVPVSKTTTALGGEIDVPTLQDKSSIDLPEGTQSGKTFRLRGKGIKRLRSSYPGDQQELLLLGRLCPTGAPPPCAQHVRGRRCQRPFSCPHNRNVLDTCMNLHARGVHPNFFG